MGNHKKEQKVPKKRGYWRILEAGDPVSAPCQEVRGQIEASIDASRWGNRRLAAHAEPYGCPVLLRQRWSVNLVKRGG